MKTGWLVNDCLTCIPGTTTFWHNLLEWFPTLIDKTNGYTSYGVLADIIENDLKKGNKPDYIIRNGTYFRPINTDVKTISLIQDVQAGIGFNNQLYIINNSTVTIFNTNYVYNKYKQYINNNIHIEIIPLGVNFDFFKPIKDRHPDVLPNSIIFIGASTNYPKGFNTVLNIIKKMTNTNFCLVMKDEFSINNLDISLRNRVKIFNRVDMEMVRLLINSCICAICTSQEETQHLSGIECGACNIPIIATNVGFYYDCSDSNEWGCIASEIDFPDKIQYVINNIDKFKPREYLIQKYSTNNCKTLWDNLINTL
jgi:glycosyltransferase involved in cell wall biosynthesis